MKVLGGELRGREFAQPPGIRPTSQKVREAIFGIIGERVEGARILDLYAGSGALGIEALSRGAAHATFVEKAPPVAKIIQQNVQKLDLVNSSQIEATSTENFLSRNPQPFGFILADPPYGEVPDALGRVAAWLAIDGLFILEYATRSDKPDWAGLSEVTTRRYGDTRVGFYRRSR